MKNHQAITAAIFNNNKLHIKNCKTIEKLELRREKAEVEGDLEEADALMLEIDDYEQHNADITIAIYKLKEELRTVNQDAFEKIVQQGF